MTHEVHIASLVVYTRPQKTAEITNAIAAMAHAETWLADASGKQIVVVEADSEREIGDCMTYIGQISGVLSVNLVYHHSESADSLAEEILL